MKMLKTLHLYLAALGVCLLPGGCGSKDMLETKVYFLDDKELSLAPERRIIEMQYAKTGEEQFVSQVESVLNTLIKGRQVLHCEGQFQKAQNCCRCHSKTISCTLISQKHSNPDSRTIHDGKR